MPRCWSVPSSCSARSTRRRVRLNGPAATSDTAAPTEFPLNDLELASRLSFFLWSQGPDEALLKVAAAGKLRDPKVLQAEALRMLNDRRAASLVRNFALKWLDLDDLDAVVPDPNLFPTFNDQLRQDLAAEIESFVASVLLGDRNVSDLLTADHTFLNERLARHYGITSVLGPQFRRVTLEDSRRRGLLGKGAMLLRTSYGDRTSPVLRGAWVMDKLMGTPPTPPPPDVETDLSQPKGEAPKTLRARLESHRSKPGCNQCHGVIDPIGLAMENFDAIGRWRDVDLEAKAPIDAKTVLPNGRPVDGPSELRQALFGGRDLFVRALTEKLMMYAVGRELEYFDMPQVRAVVRRAAAQDYRLSAIVSGIVSSDAFRMQAASAEATAPKAEGLTMFITKKHLSRRTVLQRRGCDARAAAARCDDPGGDGTGADGRRAEDAHGILLHPARRDHGQHVARSTDGSLDAKRLGRRLQTESDPAVARAASSATSPRSATCRTTRWSAACTAWRRQPG